MNKNIEPNGDIEQPIYETNYFIGVDKNNYVDSMMIALTPAESEDYTRQGLLMLSADIFECIGQDSQYINGEVIQGAPRIVQLTTEAAITIAESKIAEATTHINILQDEIDLGFSQNAGKTELTRWKTYRIALSRLDLSTAPDITWPEIPA
ncbi:tail fiber assembly protein [Rahnella sp. ChDrAdgB13]|jgi:hypothetical protein|uniref:tail fiber assembly protein n=1 Tax=Rahnella sp. ChDrAdgB13 TaxID=1850581 RepID=UPI001FCC4CDE|nr:tail fiber assembly protein [Rahnella sp. ChDrAdgB13]